MTWGNQKCRGATPALRAAPTITKKSLLNAGPARIRTEPRLCASKYLPEPLALIKGIKERLFSSKATHIPSQLVAEMTISLEMPTIAPKRKCKGTIRVRGN